MYSYVGSLQLTKTDDYTTFTVAPLQWEIAFKCTELKGYPAFIYLLDMVYAYNNIYIIYVCTSFSLLSYFAISTQIWHNSSPYLTKNCALAAPESDLQSIGWCQQCSWQSLRYTCYDGRCLNLLTSLDFYVSQTWKDQFISMLATVACTFSKEL